MRTVWPITAGEAEKRGLPIGIAEDELGVGVFGGVVLLGEEASQRGLEAEEIEVVSGDDFGLLVFSLVVPTDADAGFVGSEHAGEDLVFVAEIFVHRIGEVVREIAAEAAAGAAEASGPLEADELLWLLDGEHAEEDLIEESEDGGVGSDA